MKTIFIEAYKYKELSQKAKDKVLYWLDETPLDYENEKGELIIQFYIDMDEEYIDEHCECNGYLFSKYGEPIHHLQKKIS